jgi:hypothetical protein
MREFWSFFFQVLSINGVFPAFRSWEDTINIPAKGERSASPGSPTTALDAGCTTATSSNTTRPA